MTDRAQTLREEILKLSVEYHQLAFPAKEFFPGASSVPVSGKVLDGEDLRNLVDGEGRPLQDAKVTGKGGDGLFAVTSLSEERRVPIAEFVEYGVGAVDALKQTDRATSPLDLGIRRTHLIGSDAKV